MKNKKKKFRSFSQALKFISGIISWVILVVLVIIASFLLYYFVSMRVYAQKGEDYKPAFSLYTILTGSMIPNINVYDVVVDVNVKNPADIHEGDVITFVSTATLTQGMTITHRVISVIHDENGYSYVTKGDANLSPDGAAVPYENVLGKVILHIPQLGRLQSFLATRGGWLIVVVIPALCVIISDILKLFRLKSTKNKVDSYTTQEEQKKLQDQKEKEIIEQKLIRRYTKKRKENEPDPLPRKEFSILDLLPKLKKVDLPKKIEMPKLKSNDSVNDKKPKRKKRKSVKKK